MARRWWRMALFRDLIFVNLIGSGAVPYGVSVLFINQRGPGGETLFFLNGAFTGFPKLQ